MISSDVLRIKAAPPFVLRRAKPPEPRRIIEIVARSINIPPTASKSDCKRSRRASKIWTLATRGEERRSLSPVAQKKEVFNDWSEGISGGS